MANFSGKQVIDTSAIIDMEVMDGDESDYETSMSGSMTVQDDGHYGQKREPQQSPYVEDVQKKVTQNVASYVWQSGSQQAKSYISTYANIDLLRPYFNVEPHEVRQRLLWSLMPQKPGSAQQKVPRELYGPTMLILTMIALLLYQMKTSGHIVQEGTLMGTAFGTCFGYWLGVSGFIWFLAYVCNAHITMLQILCLIGYALFGHCVVLGLTTLFHTTHDHMFFYIMWVIFGGLSTLRLVSVIMSRTAGQTQRLIVCGAVAVLHLCFLLYLHFTYHRMVEDLSDMMKHVGVPQPGMDAPEGRRIVERSVVGMVPLPDNLLKHPPGLATTLPPPLLTVPGGPRVHRPEQANHLAPPLLQATATVLKPGQPIQSLLQKVTDKVVLNELPKMAQNEINPKVVVPNVFPKPMRPFGSVGSKNNLTKTGRLVQTLDESEKS